VLAPCTAVNANITALISSNAISSV